MIVLQRFMLGWAVATGAAAIAGCGSTEEAAGRGASSDARPAAIEGIVWTLVDVGGTPAAPAPQDERQAFILLQDGRVTGSSGVNNLSGAYRIDGFALRFGPIAMTRRAGSSQAMSQETALGKALSSTTSYRRSSGVLRILDSQGRQLATFQAAQDPR